MIDFDAKKYAVCDQAKCETLDFNDWPDGIYVGLTFPRRELMVKINLTDNSILETSTFLGSSVTSFGKCAANKK